MLSSKVKVEVKRFSLDKKDIRMVNDFVATEVPVEIHVNNQHVVTLFSTPNHLKELGIGWLLSHAIVNSAEEISNVYVKDNKVKIRCTGDVKARIEAAKLPKMIDSSCGSTSEDFAFLIDRMVKPFVNSNYTVEAEKILQFVKILNKKSALFRQTGGTHSAAIFHKEELVAFAEDVGRHNAVDKVIGLAAIKKVDFPACVLVSSGRQTANMVLKAARVGIPIVASIAGPVHSGIEAALKTGISLICFARGRRINVYSHPERIGIPRARFRCNCYGFNI